MISSARPRAAALRRERTKGSVEEKKIARVLRGLSCMLAVALGGLVFDHGFLAGIDLDDAWLVLFRDLADEVNMQEAVFHACADHLDGLGEFKILHEGAGCKTTMQIFHIFLLFGGFAADLQRVPGHYNFDLVLREAGNGHGDAIMVRILFHNVVRGKAVVAGSALKAPENLFNPVKADG